MKNLSRVRLALVALLCGTPLMAQRPDTTEGPVFHPGGVAVGAVVGAGFGYGTGLLMRDVDGLRSGSSDFRTGIALSMVGGAILGATAGSIVVARWRSKRDRPTQPAVTVETPAWIASNRAQIPLYLGDSLRLYEAPDCDSLSTDLAGQVISISRDSIEVMFPDGLLTLRGDGRVVVRYQRPATTPQRGDDALAFVAGSAVGQLGAIGGWTSGTLIGGFLYVTLAMVGGLSVGEPQGFVRSVSVLGAIVGAVGGATHGVLVQGQQREALAGPRHFVGTLRFANTAPVEIGTTCRWVPGSAFPP